MPDLKPLAKHSTFEPAHSQAETILTEKMTMLETSPTLDSSRKELIARLALQKVSQIFPE